MVCPTETGGNWDNEDEDIAFDRDSSDSDEDTYFTWD